jgi:hypothetical protein
MKDGDIIIQAPPKGWLGNHSPEKKIRESGLWQVKGLWGTPLDDEDIKYIEDL